MMQASHARARLWGLLASAGRQLSERRAVLDSSDPDIATKHPGNSRGVLLADIRPIVDEEKMPG